MANKILKDLEGACVSFPSLKQNTQGNQLREGGGWLWLMVFDVSSPLLAGPPPSDLQKGTIGDGWEHKAEKIAYLVLRKRKGLGFHNPFPHLLIAPL